MSYASLPFFTNKSPPKVSSVGFETIKVYWIELSVAASSLPSFVCLPFQVKLNLLRVSPNLATAEKLPVTSPVAVNFCPSFNLSKSFNFKPLTVNVMRLGATVAAPVELTAAFSF